MKAKTNLVDLNSAKKMIGKVNLKKINWTKIIAGLSYFQILVIVPLILRKRDELIRYHSNQGLVLLVIWVLFVFSFFFPILPYLFALYILSSIIIGIMNISLGNKRPILFIGKLAK